MHYIESGAGTPLALLHAFPVDTRMSNSSFCALLASNRLLTHVADLDARGRGHDLRALVEVMIRTTAENLEGERRPGWFLRFVANAMYVEDIAPFDLTANEWSSGQAALHARIAEHLADLPPRLRQDRWDHFAGLLVHTPGQP
ncbi:hypothetical protein [Saccharopolyspora sp. NPDC050642]|uniref:hypothetical protein n=1 Tax=Saccharopolyspora sp. NPDC050642 TaxID=3157099 RepID=UPI0033C789C4